MSTFADFYIARDDDEARTYDSVPATFVKYAQPKLITRLEVSTLRAIMRNIEWDETLLDDFPCILDEERNKRLVHKLPADMVAEMSRLTTSQVTRIAASWAATEELNCPADDARIVIEGLIQLSKHATESGGNIYLWNS